MDEVVAQLKDEDFLTALVERTHDQLIASGRWSYAAFIAQFDDVVSEEARSVGNRSMTTRLRLAKIERAVRVPPVHLRLSRSLFGAISRLTGRPFKPRIKINVGALFGKATLAFRAVLGDAELRPIFREGLRAGMHRDTLVEEIVKFSVLRGVASARLRTNERFTVIVDFDAACGVIRFRSRRVEQGIQPVNGSARLAREALRAGTVKAIEWDHSALGKTVRLRKPRVELGIGQKGLKSFTLLVEIGRRKPALLDQALAPLIGADQIQASRLG
jgi:hypothetical protein